MEIQEIKELFAYYGLRSLVEGIGGDGDKLKLTPEGCVAMQMIQKLILQVKLEASKEKISEMKDLAGKLGFKLNSD